jgi:hypothetical protein
MWISCKNIVLRSTEHGSCFTHDSLWQSRVVYRHIHKHMHTHVHTYTHIHTHIYTHTHTHTHTQIIVSSKNIWCWNRNIWLTERNITFLDK